jgi:hypothetical protein
MYIFLNFIDISTGHVVQLNISEPLPDKDQILKWDLSSLITCDPNRFGRQRTQFDMLLFLLLEFHPNSRKSLVTNDLDVRGFGTWLARAGPWTSMDVCRCA